MSGPFSLRIAHLPRWRREYLLNLHAAFLAVVAFLEKWLHRLTGVIASPRSTQGGLKGAPRDLQRAPFLRIIFRRPEETFPDFVGNGYRSPPCLKNSPPPT
eukprot:1393578-Amorphochlora_amoeboformis.AAC.1